MSPPSLRVYQFRHYALSDWTGLEPAVPGFSHHVHNNSLLITDQQDRVRARFWRIPVSNVCDVLGVYCYVKGVACSGNYCVDHTRQRFY